MPLPLSSLSSRLLLAVLVSAIAVVCPACDDGAGSPSSDDSDADSDTDSDSDADSDSDTDADTDSDSGSDSDSDSDGDCTDIAWGSGFTLGQPVANWSYSGYIDSDDDGFVEQVEVGFTLEDIGCTGKQSVVYFIGDTT